MLVVFSVVISLFFQLQFGVVSTTPNFNTMKHERENDQEFVDIKVSHQTKIIGGDFVWHNNTNQNPYPYLVSVQAYNPLKFPLFSNPIYNYSHICGGTVLNADHILTGGECNNFWTKSCVRFDRFFYESFLRSKFER